MPLRLIAVALAAGLVALLFHLGGQPFLAGLVPAPWDKMAHGVSFGCLAGSAWIALGGRGPSAALGAIALAMAIGVMDEAAQLTLPGRTASGFDLMADVAGAVVAVSVMAVLKSRLANASMRLRYAQVGSDLGAGHSHEGRAFVTSVGDRASGPRR